MFVVFLAGKFLATEYTEDSEEKDKSLATDFTDFAQINTDFFKV